MDSALCCAQANGSNNSTIEKLSRRETAVCPSPSSCFSRILDCKTWRKRLSHAVGGYAPTWIMDNRPLPPHAVIPNLQIGRVPVTNWQQLKQATKRQREMVIKISGFSELSWGSQGVCIGHDVSSKVWSDTIDHALDSFPHNPYILQKFYKGKRVSASYYDLDSKAPKLIEGRARLCPYYMVHQDHVQLAGVLATICPLDKKLIHGMVDAVMVPTMVKWE